jgi:chemotaxis protein CheD
MKNLTDPRLPNVYLKAGELYVSRQPALVSTVLGSCVSVILHVPSAALGGICHAMLPESGRESDGFLYVDRAVTHIYQRLIALCGHGTEMEAKLFGGAEVLNPGDRADSLESVGHRNIRAAHRIITDLGLRITGSDTGGVRGRKIFYYTQSGEVFLRHVRKTVQQPNHPLSSQRYRS